MELGVNPLTPHDYRGGVGGSFFCLDCGQRPEALIHTYRPADHSKPIPLSSDKSEQLSKIRIAQKLLIETDEALMKYVNDLWHKVGLPGRIIYYEEVMAITAILMRETK